MAFESYLLSRRHDLRFGEGGGAVVADGLGGAVRDVSDCLALVGGEPLLLSGESADHTNGKLFVGGC